MIHRGDILVFRTTNPYYKLLNKWAGWKYPLYGEWLKDNFAVWHLAPVVAWVKHPITKKIVSVYTLDAELGGAKVKIRDIGDIQEHCKCYRWLDREPTLEECDEFVARYERKRYDVRAILISSFMFLSSMEGRWVNDRYHCQEITARFCLERGKPVLPMHLYPIHPRIVPEIAPYEVEIG